MEISLNKYERVCIFLIGFTCSLSGIMIADYTFSNFVIVALVLGIFLRNGLKVGFYNSLSGRATVYFMICIILSIISAGIYLPISWVMYSIATFIKYIICFVPFFLMLKNNEKIYARNLFFKGFFYAAIIHMIWGYAQLILYVLFKFELNTFFFEDILHTTGYNWDGYTGGINGKLIRMMGLTWEPSNFSFIMIIGYILCKNDRKKIILKYMFLIALILSTSKSGYVAFAAVILVECIKKLHKSRITLRRVNISGILFLTVGITIAVFIFFQSKEVIMDYVISMFRGFSKVLDTTDKKASNSIHIAYYEYLPLFISSMSLIQLFFGVGYYCAGAYISMHRLGLGSITDVGWNPETDVVTLLLGNGIIGFCVYYGIGVKGFLLHKNDSMGLMIVTVLAEGITYIVARGTYPMLILFMGLIPETLSTTEIFTCKV